MKRGRLPAYGKDLIALRNAGAHPERVWVIVGDDWQRRPVNAPTLCVKADDKPGVFDWSICAGLPVHVVDRGGDFAGVAAAVARFAAPVVVHWLYGEEDWPGAPGSKGQADVTLVMWSLRQQTTAGCVNAAGWSDALAADYVARREAYRDALMRDAARKLKEIEAA